LRVLGSGELNRNVDFLVADPVGLGCLDSAPAPAAARIRLAPFECESEIVDARIAGNDLEPSADQAVEDIRIDVGFSARSVGGEYEGACEEVRGAAYPDAMPDAADRHLIVGAADPVERDRIVVGAFTAKQPIERNAAREHADHAAVARQHV